MSNNMTEKQIKELRDILSEELKEYNGEKNILLPFDTDSLEILLFDRIPEGGKKFAFYMEETIKKLDLSNVSFKDFDAYCFDFSGYTGVNIDPQTLKDKSLYCAICRGVTFTNFFDNVYIRGTDFEGSDNVYVDPQTVRDRTLFQTKCAGVTFINLFDGCNIEGTNFKGSNDAYINPEKVQNKSLYETKLADATVVGTFDDVDVRGTDFDGVNYNGYFDPQKVRNKSLHGTKCYDKFIKGSLDGVDIDGTENCNTIKSDDVTMQISINKENFKRNVKHLISKYNK